MKNKDTYKNKTQNMFTAYVVRSVKGARMKYIDKNNYRESMENHLEDDAEYEPMIHFDDYYEAVKRERLLENEKQGRYPDWEELSDDQLIKAIRLLQKEERALIFQHVFQQKSFDKISRESGKPRNKLENRYYYALKKIRQWMGGAE